MSPPSPSLAPAIDEAESGAASARGIEMIYRNERHALVRFITRYRSNPEDAGDVAQEAFLKLARSEQGRTDTILQPRAFLRQIARNLMRNQAKSDARRGAHLHVALDEDTVSDTNEVARLEARDGLKSAAERISDQIARHLGEATAWPVTKTTQGAHANLASNLWASASRNAGAASRTYSPCNGN